MKTHQISNQNFTAGRLKFVRTVGVDGSVDDLSVTLLPQLDKSILKELKKKIANKPYDLFISRPKDLRGFYSVDANTEFSNVLSDNSAVKGRSSLVYAGRFERFISAAEEAIDSFEKVPKYENLLKKHNIFSWLINKIIKMD